MIKAVIFDMDGLMFDTETLNAKGWRHAGALRGYDITPELHRECIGMNLQGTRQTMVASFGEEFDFDAVRRDRIDYTFGEIEKNGTPLKTGLLELLDYLRSEGIRTAIASSSAADFVRFYLEHAGLDHEFDVIVSGDMVARSKPAPDIFLAAAERLGLPAEECIVLEDSYNGIRAAHEAGIRVVMIPDLLPPTPEVEKLFFCRLDSLLDVIGLLEKLNLETNAEARK